MFKCPAESIGVADTAQRTIPHPGYLLPASCPCRCGTNALQSARRMQGSGLVQFWLFAISACHAGYENFKAMPSVGEGMDLACGQGSSGGKLAR
ncbi:hypothetical protein SRHO_G00334380 [Serrasalmus rhombeus]